MDGSVSRITLSSYGRTGCGFLGVTCADNRGMLASRPLLCHLPSHVGCDPQDICCALLDCTALQPSLTCHPSSQSDPSLPADPVGVQGPYIPILAGRLSLSRAGSQLFPGSHTARPL